MGLFSGGGIGSSANTTTTTTDNKNNATSGSGSIYDTRGGGINFLDAGAIEKSFEFAAQSLGRSYSLADSVSKTSLSTSAAERTAGATNTLWIAGAALAAIVLFAFVQKG